MIKSFANKVISPARQNYLQGGFVKKFTGVLSVDILVKASSFILLPFFLRLMTQEEFGLYNYLLSIIQTFSVVMNLGLYIPQTKFFHSYSSAKERGQMLFTIFVTLVCLLTLICIPLAAFKLDFKIVAFLFESHINYDKYRGIVFMALIISVLSFMLTNFLYTSEKIKQVKTYNIFRIVVVNLVALAALYFITGDAVHTRIGFSYSAELILWGLFSFFLFREMVPEFKKRLMWKSIRMGFPIMISALFGIFVNFSDKFLLQKYGSLKDLSNYYLAFSFAGIIALIFSSLQNVWLPVFMKEKDVEVNFQKTKMLISKLFAFFLILGILIWLLFLVMFWTSVIPSKYAPVLWILPVLLIAQILTAITSLFTNYLIYFEKTILASLSGFIVSLISIGLGLWLIPRWNIAGAAITVLIINLVYVVFYYFLVMHLKNRHLKQNLI